jgi:peptidoglycan/LPS O-acetylase OafA/YrhL
VGETGLRYHYIDALRGYAILGVLMVHGGQAVGLDQATAWGARGVQLFFVVSALTLTASWNDRSDGAAAFYIRRLFRIAPMFWLAIPVYLLLNGMNALFYAPIYAPNGIHLWHVGMTAAFVHGLHPETVTSVVPGGWSVADEMLFYAVFPLLALIITKWQRAAVLCAVSALLPNAWYNERTLDWLVSMFPDEPRWLLRDFMFLSFPAQITAFAAGILACHVIRSLPKGASPRWAIELALLVALAALAWQCITNVNFLVPFGLWFGVAAAAMGLGAGRYLVNPLIRHFGTLSFSMYLVHFALIGSVAAAVRATDASGPWSSLIILFPTLVLATAAVASLTYRYIEQPGIRFGRRVVDWRLSRAKNGVVGIDATALPRDQIS